MLNEEHDIFLDLIVEYYNCREKWLENNTNDAGVAYRKVLKKLMRHSKVMADRVQEVQHERRRRNIETFNEFGWVPRKGKPVSKK